MEEQSGQLTARCISTRGQRGSTQGQGHAGPVVGGVVSCDGQGRLLVTASTLPLQADVKSDDGLAAAQLLQQAENDMDLLTCECLTYV